MKIAKIPQNETDRLNDLEEYKIMDTAAEKEFDDLVRLASKICSTPMSTITLVDSQRQWFKSRLGIDYSQTDRDPSFCSHTILGHSLMLVSDACQDDRFRNNPFVRGAPGIRFYAGIPLTSYRGNAIGALCVLDIVPRDLDTEQRFALDVLGQQVIRQLELKRVKAKLEEVYRIQSLLLNMIVRDIKSPLSSTGTFLNLLQKDINVRFDLLKFANAAAKQFNTKLSLLDTLVEWGQLYSQHRDTRVAALNTDMFVNGLTNDLKKDSRARHFEWTNKAREVRIFVRHQQEMYFMVKCAMLWLLDVADNGLIMVDEMAAREQGVNVRLSMVSRSFVKDLPQSIELFRRSSLWPEKADIPVDWLPLRLARDAAISRNGDLTVELKRDDVIEINIRAGVL
jgi:hypothetical protein